MAWTVPPLAQLWLLNYVKHIHEISGTWAICCDSAAAQCETCAGAHAVHTACAPVHKDQVRAAPCVTLHLTQQHVELKLQSVLTVQNTRHSDHCSLRVG